MKKNTKTQKSSLLHPGNEPPTDDLFRSDDQLAGMVDDEAEDDEDDDDENNREIMNSNDASGGGSAEDDAINRLVDSNNGTATTSYKETGGHNKELMMTATDFINNNNISDEDDNSGGGSKSNHQMHGLYEYITQQMNEMQEQVRNSLTGASYEVQKGSKRKAPNTPTSKGTDRKKASVLEGSLLGRLSSATPTKYEPVCTRLELRWRGAASKRRRPVATFGLESYAEQFADRCAKKESESKHAKLPSRVLQRLRECWKTIASLRKRRRRIYKICDRLIEKRPFYSSIT